MSCHLEAVSQFLFQSATVEYLEVSADGYIVHANGAFARHATRAETVAGQSVFQFLAAPDAARLRAWLSSAPPHDFVQLTFLESGGRPYALRSVVTAHAGGLVIVGECGSRLDVGTAEQLMEINNELARLSRENARRGKELAKALDERERTFWHLRRIQEVLPICMSCGKVRTGEAKWQTLADYLRESSILMSHGYCPPCYSVAAAEFGLEAGR